MPRNDFNGDGRSDVLWLLNEHDAVSNWLSTPQGGFAINDDVAFNWLPDWPAEFVAAGDFNGDQRSDVLWRYDAGAWGPGFFYEMTLGEAGGGLTIDSNGISPGAPRLPFVTDPGWRVVSTGDFNGDGYDDLLWRHDNGTISNWLGSSTGDFHINDSNAMAAVSNSWQVVGAGDFNGDGHSDILWRSDSGWISNWLGTDDGGWIINDANAMTHYGPDELHIGDFNSDGRDDLLLRGSDGALSMSAAFSDGSFDLDWGPGFVANVPPNWQIAEVGDYDGNGAADILWREQGGAISNWLGMGDGYTFNINDVNAFHQIGTDWRTTGELF
jgi:FG-GAP-like repeat